MAAGYFAVANPDQNVIKYIRTPGKLSIDLSLYNVYSIYILPTYYENGGGFHPCLKYFYEAGLVKFLEARSADTWNSHPIFLFLMGGGLKLKGVGGCISLPPPLRFIEWTLL